jgi:hypothetical protein
MTSDQLESHRHAFVVHFAWVAAIALIVALLSMGVVLPVGLRGSGSSQPCKQR